MSALLFVLAALGAYRLTRCFTTDSIFETPREMWFDRFPPNAERGQFRRARVAGGEGQRAWVMVHRAQDTWRPPHKLGQLVECPWCIGFWIAGAVTLVTAQVVSVPLPLLVWWALSTAVGFLGLVDERLQ